MMKKNITILTNNGGNDFEELMINLAAKANTIKLATAFFSDVKLINQWTNDLKKISLLVSLRPPTNYYSLKNVYNKRNVNVHFLGTEFHSKFFIFYNDDIPFACIIGSSNFTAGGIYKNIETNAVIYDDSYLKEIDKEFSGLWNNSYKLQPIDLAAFKVIFDKFRDARKKEALLQIDFEEKILKNRSSEIVRPKTSKKAKEYYKFWTIVDEIREIVAYISEQQYPNVPVYLAIDHFWHWIKVVWSKKNKGLSEVNDNSIIIKELFLNYCKWDKDRSSYTEKMAENSESIFSFSLSENKIDSLSLADARKIFSSLHSGAMRTKRFYSDQKFITENSIEQIKSSFKYLLYSNEELEIRIHKLHADPDYKLRQFSLSGIQELIGWVMPEKYPIRNEKADDAVKLLGYHFK